VVLDGSYMGCEIARGLARSASVNADQLYHRMVYGATSAEKIAASIKECDREIAIVTEGAKIGGGYESGTSWPVMMDLGRLGVKKFKGAQNILVADGAVSFTDEKGESVKIDCDCVIVPSHHSPEHELTTALEARGFETLTAGDAKAPAKAIQAIRAACEAGVKI
jgi:hypothetical protein